MGPGINAQARREFGWCFASAPLGGRDAEAADATNTATEPLDVWLSGP